MENEANRLRFFILGSPFSVLRSSFFILPTYTRVRKLFHSLLTFDPTPVMVPPLSFPKT